MKKIELHCHFDGSIDQEYASKLLGYNICDKLGNDGYKSLSEYLDDFSIFMPILQSKDHLIMSSYYLAKSLVSDEVIYAEIRFCPFFHTEEITPDEVIKSILFGLSKVDNLKTNLILCMMRQFDEEKNRNIIDLAKKYLNHGVCAIDLAGDENRYPTSNFKSLFEYAKSLNVPYTIHAGESSDYKSVDEAISFDTKRIGHGVRAIENDRTIQSLIAKKITLEVCLKSNIDTGIYHHVTDHPIRKLFDKGVLLTINTDNRTISNTSLDYEYNLLKKYFNFTDEDLRGFNLNAINAAFLSKEEKEKLELML